VIDRVEEPFDVCNNGPCAAAIFNDLVMSTGGDAGQLSHALARGRNDPTGPLIDRQP
jgi:hypothetical protein